MTINFLKMPDKEREELSEKCSLIWDKIFFAKITKEEAIAEYMSLGIPYEYAEGNYLEIISNKNKAELGLH